MHRLESAEWSLSLTEPFWELHDAASVPQKGLKEEDVNKEITHLLRLVLFYCEALWATLITWNEIIMLAYVSQVPKPQWSEVSVTVQQDNGSVQAGSAILEVWASFTTTHALHCVYKPRLLF